MIDHAAVSMFLDPRGINLGDAAYLIWRAVTGQANPQDAIDTLRAIADYVERAAQTLRAGGPDAWDLHQADLAAQREARKRITGEETP